MNAPPLGRWRAKTTRRATRADVVAVATIVLLALGTVVAGRRANVELPPRAAVEMTEVLDGLEQPTRLPDAPLADEAGHVAMLFSLIQERHAVVAFYAPWCRPCQKELPLMAAEAGPEVSLIIVVSQSEDVLDTRQQLTNIGMAAHAFYVDTTGKLFESAHVTALPSTFLVTRLGAVIARWTGFSPMALAELRARLRNVSPKIVLHDGGAAP